MEKKNEKTNDQSRLRAFLTGDRLKALLPLIGFVIIIIVMHIMTDGKILTPKKLRLLFCRTSCSGPCTFSFHINPEVSAGFVIVKVFSTYRLQ